MGQYEKDHLAMAEMLWSTLYALNSADSGGTGPQELRWYFVDNTRDVASGQAEKLTPYAHVQSALDYALVHLTGSDSQAERLRELLADNGESVAGNLDIVRREADTERQERFDTLYEQF